MSCDMWFGTQDHAGWIDTPLSGADVSPSAWGDSGTLLNGSGYAINSYNSHKEYVFSWRSTSSRRSAQLMKSYFDGSYGRGKLYFQDPLTYTTNILPARWADPSITTGFEGPSLIPGIEPARVKASPGEGLGLPVFSAQYKVATTRTYRMDTLFVPIPDGMDLHMGAFYEATNNAGVYYATVSDGGRLSDVDVKLDPLRPQSGKMFSHVVTKQPGGIGVALWLGQPQNGPLSSLTVNAIHARLTPNGSSDVGEPFWYGGQGNSGVRFAGPPTYVNNTGRDGGQVEFAATFIESVI